MPDRSPLHRQLDGLLASLGGSDDAARRLACHLTAWAAEQLINRYGYGPARAALLHAFDVAREEHEPGDDDVAALREARPAGRA